MMPTVVLMVRLRMQGATDRLGNPVTGYADAIEVGGCLWAPGAPSDIGENRPEGVHIAATAHFPRGWQGNLRGALVSVDGERWLTVIGDPLPYPAGTVRGNWDRQVLLEADDG